MKGWHGRLQTTLNSMWNGYNENKWWRWFNRQQTLSGNYWVSDIYGCNKARHLLYSYKVIPRYNETKFILFNESKAHLTLFKRHNQSVISKKSEKPLKLKGFCDTDWANLSDRKSMSGYCFRMEKDNPMISWKSKKQISVVLSTCEVEFIVISWTSQDVLYLRALLGTVTEL